MGKPFEKELYKIGETFQWAINQDVSELGLELLYNKPNPLFIVGSGGSLSACHYAAILFQQYGLMAKAVTPLELFYSQNALRNSNVLFISASGKNTDILFGYKTAINLEPNRIYSLCMKKNSPLAKLAANTSISKHYEFDSPSGKDGFLATNSLVSFFSLIYNVFKTVSDSTPLAIPNKESLSGLEEFLNKVSPSYTFNVLYAGFGYPVAIDIESKLVEAALADVIISDYRNFGHGRHHWFAKRKANSAIIAVITPEEELIAQKTLSLLPSDIPTLIIRTNYNSPFASIDLLIKSFYFVDALGKLQNIDPGRPGVPDYGSKLYNLKYTSLFKEKNDIPELERIAILRKVKAPSISTLGDEEKIFWSNAYKTFKETLKNTEFGSIIFDYDGTLCSSSSRYTGIDKNITQELIKLLDKGLVIGVATGRGQSVRNDLHSKIPAKYHSNVVVGYYNCADIGTLKNTRLPNKKGIKNELLQNIFELIKSYPFPEDVCPELKPNQVTVEIKDKKGWQKVRSIIIDLVLSKNYFGIQILESSHSIDIIDQTSTSKLNILAYCNKIAKKSKKTQNCLCIGDKGQWPGNDYQLLSSPHSLSVDEVSSLNEMCWNLVPPGIKNIKATLYYLSYLTFNKNGAAITLP
jgi:hydroxymethylpyrimidine pyrophosphatase-like HAD family hydrolase